MSTVRFQAACEDFLLTIDGVARFLIQNGQNISVEPADDANPDLVGLFLSGSAMGALLLQRGILPLHGSSVCTPHGALIFCGASGYGKSTLAAAFSNRGFPVISDDVSAVRFSENGFQLLPASPNLYLWQDALEYLQLKKNNLRRAVEREDKYQIPLPAQNIFNPVNILSIYLLQPDNVPSVVLSPLSGFDKINALINNTYRLQFIAPMGLERWHFDKICEVAAQTRIVRAYRPVNSYQLSELISAIESDF
jgi:hypothetical protein